jgi:flagellar L-ring protein precursor FlgH
LYIGLTHLSAGSLWNQGNAGERSMFADRTAQLRGDLVTIIVSENSSMINNMNLTTERESSIKNEITKFLFSNVLMRNDEVPSTDITIGKNDHTGKGAISNTNTLNARISVQVVDVLPNGNLVLEGVRTIAYSGETYFMLTQGICRRDDISTTNTVSSSLLADARIEIISEGSLSESQRKGWLMRFADKFSP